MKRIASYKRRVALLPAFGVALLLLLQSHQAAAQCDSSLARRLPGRALECEPEQGPIVEPLPVIVFPAHVPDPLDGEDANILNNTQVISNGNEDVPGMSLESIDLPPNDDGSDSVPQGGREDLDSRPRLGRVNRQQTQQQAARERTQNPVSPIPVPKLDDYREAIPLPDRWRIVDSLGYESSLFDPFNISPLKADKPFAGEWFFNLGVISDSTYESRKVVTPVGVSSSRNSGNNDVFGESDQSLFNQNLLVELVAYKGDTVFRPPDYEFRLTTAFNYNYTELDEVLGVNVAASQGRTRSDQHVGIQAAFVDKHLRNVSDRYDFDSVRVGIQPFNADFRGFLFQDNQFGVRLFGTRNNNIFQYNLALFQRLEKDTNSGLNDLGESLREDYVAAANLYWQDLFVKGFVSQFTVVHNHNNEEGEFYFDNNGFIARPASLGTERSRGYDVTYFGYSGDGHIDRVNLSTSLYYAIGQVKPGVFVRDDTDIRAGFAAAELSMDFDWIRPKLSLLYASGDDDPFDDEANGFDAIFENPQFAGSDASYWVRQSVPLVGGGRVGLSPRNGVLNSLRSSKEQGQSNFTNPGMLLAGVGVDMDILPQLRVSANYNAMFFDKTQVLEVARNQANIDAKIGDEFSIAAIYRPLNSQNIVLRASYSHLFPGGGFKDLFRDENTDYFFLNILLAY